MFFLCIWPCPTKTSQGSLVGASLLDILQLYQSCLNTVITAYKHPGYCLSPLKSYMIYQCNLLILEWSKYLACLKIVLRILNHTKFDRQNSMLLHPDWVQIQQHREMFQNPTNSIFQNNSVMWQSGKQSKANPGYLPWCTINETWVIVGRMPYHEMAISIE